MSKTPNTKFIEGKYINLREVREEDSEFILELRCNEKKSRYINKTEYNIEKQRNYIKKYLTLENEWYFIIEDKNGKPLGTNSVYPYPILDECWRDSQNPEIGVLGTGRWLLIDGLTPLIGLESDCIIKQFFFETLKRPFTPMMIHEDNIQVLKFHQKWGAKIFGYAPEIKHHLLNLTVEDYNKNRGFFERMIYGKKQ